MKKIKCLSALFALSTVTAMIPAIASCSTANSDKNSSNNSATLSKSGVCKVTFLSTDKDVKFEGNTVAEIKSGRKFGSIDKPTATKTGFKFEHWAYSDNGAEIKDTAVISSSTTVTPVFSQEQVTVTINKMDGSQSTTEKVNIGDSITLPAVTRSGYEFKNWVDQDGKNYEAEATVTILKDMSFSVQWNEITVLPAVYTISENQIITLNMKTLCSETDDITGEYFLTKEPIPPIERSKFNIPIFFGQDIENIQDNFLAGCYKYNQLITLPSTIKTIGDNFMGGCYRFNNLFTIPTSVVSIGNKFMYECIDYDNTLTIPASVQSIGDYFFAGNTSAKMKISKLISFADTDNSPSQLKSIGSYFMSYCSTYNNALTLPSALTSIGDFFMNNCTTFAQAITIPGSVVSIGGDMYNECSSYGTITFGANSQLKNFGSFYNFSSKASTILVLTDSGITFTDGLLYNSNTKACLGASTTFDGTIPTDCITIGDNFLYRCNNYSKDITFPKTLTSIGKGFLSGYHDNTVSYMNFKGTINLKETSVVSIGDDFMADCVYASNYGYDFDLPSTLKTVGNKFMHYNSNYQYTLTIPATVTSIGDNFLNYCNNFDTLEFEASSQLESIGSYFMQGCSTFNQDLTIPASVTSVGEYFMYNCEDMCATITVNNNPEYWGESNYTLSTPNKSEPMYKKGITINSDVSSEYVTAFKAKFPDRTSSPYRKLIAE